MKSEKIKNTSATANAAKTEALITFACLLESFAPSYCAAKIELVAAIPPSAKSITKQGLPARLTAATVFEPSCPIIIWSIIPKHD
ncbi:MAG: hypothetical protein L6V90_07920 [Treponema succinifaciens]|nr:MAG: hypothetical protein L6V90_07920 [Treponema succinifaciens]